MTTTTAPAPGDVHQQLLSELTMTAYANAWADDLTVAVGGQLLAMPSEDRAADPGLLGRRRILERHAPRRSDITDTTWCAHGPCYQDDTHWPCDDYRDAAAALHAADLLPGGGGRG